MGYTTNEGRVRVDLFCDTGKWYATGSIGMADFYRGDIFEGVLRACEREFASAGHGEWPVTAARVAEREGTIVVLEPYHEHAHPIMLTHARVDRMCRVDALTEAELVALQRKIDERLVQLRASQLGAPGVRDPDALCEGYDPGAPGSAPLADCDSDGHYLCAGCKRLVVCRECGKHCQAVAPSTCAPDCTGVEP